MLAVKSISFTEAYAEELAYFMRQPNKSRYICELIRKDMIGGDIGGLTREQVISIIDERLSSLPTVTETEGDNREIRDNLIGLFGNL